MTMTLAVSVACGFLIPAVVDLVTKSHLSNSVKAFLAAALAALAGALSTVTWSPHQRWQDYLIAVAAAFVTTFTAHSTGYSRPIQRGTSKVGIG